MLRAGAAEVDLTPSPGLPTHGYSSAGVSCVEGHWLRLKGRIVALEDADGTRLALVQADLGASSALLHRRLAANLADLGIGPASLLLATTHTHGGPGGFFGHRFYNEWVASRAGFDPKLTDLLTRRLAEGVRRAFATLRPARLGVAQATVAPQASHNRSRPAWEANFLPGFEPDEDVDRRLTLLRVDVADEEGHHRPLAAWTVYAVHGTTMGPGYPFFHGDVHGAAARLVAHRVAQRQPTAGPFVAAMTNGAEGDVGPGQRPVQGKEVTMAVAGHVADAAMAAFAALDATMAQEAAGDHRLGYGYREAWVKGASTQEGALCLNAELGKPQLAGSEEGPGPLPELHFYEGETGPDRGCQGRKVKAGGALQGSLVDASDFPGRLPFQVVHVGDLLTLAAVPGEPTTEVGRAVSRRVEAVTGRPTAVVGLANGYVSYLTMRREYQAQHYEGGATLYGKHEGLLVVETLEQLARDSLSHPVDRSLRQRAFEPGAAQHRGGDEDCDAKSWEAGEIGGEGAIVTFSFRGPDEDAACDPPSVAIVCGGAILHDANGWPQTDEGFNFEIARRGDDDWVAAWTARATSSETCRFRVDRPGGLAPLFSEPFTL
jgi:neutral ceramidase